jgi:formate hydrogenlyase subunit 3/multisubunit Na+/H+ antiporter MnhD subunit
MDVLLSAILLLAASGTAALFLSPFPRAASVVGAGGAVVSSLLGIVPALVVLLGGPAQSARFDWDATHGLFQVELDLLSAFFLVPVFSLSTLAAIYGGNYLLACRHERALGAPWFFCNFFIAGMALVVIARTVLLFLVAWEIMSIAAYFLVTMEHEKAEVRRAGWIYLIATHLGVIFIISVFLLLSYLAGGSTFAGFRAMTLHSGGWSGLLFLLALIGFGAKAGLSPFHVWLPEAHPAAPSHVSALMSGVMIKMGVYGFLRILTFLGPPAFWWGPLLAVFGLLTALIGVGLALQQRDLKRALAYSSIENIGLIVLALGVALWGSANGLGIVAALGMTAAALHLWNHALMKSLMFLAAGSVLHATGERDVERLGGLLQRMPWTGNLMLFGAIAIAGLPPLNGFVGEWLLYLGLMQSGLVDESHHALAPLLSIGVVALIGTLAAFAFVRLTGIALLGSPRTDAAGHAHESSYWMIVPMLVLAILCLIYALAPDLAVNILAPVVDQVLGRPAGQTLTDLDAAGAPLSGLGAFNACLLVAIGLAGGGSLLFLPKARQAFGTTWGCGYAQPTPRIQYTGHSFAEMLTGYLLPRFLRPRAVKKAPEGLFPLAGEYQSECPDPLTTKVYEPFFRRWANRFVWLRILQQGKVHVYLFFIMITVVLALGWISLRAWWRSA